MAWREETGRCLQAFLDERVAAGELSAAVGMVGDAGGPLWSGVAGEARPGSPATLATRFDYGSLVKPFVATLALALDASGDLPLTTRIGEAFGPGEAHPALAGRTLEALLRHEAGVRHWVPLYHVCRAPAEVPSLLLGGELLGERRGTYSDLDFIVWALAVERLLAQPLAGLLAERVLAPLGVRGVEVAPGDRPDVAVCRCDTAQEVRLALAQQLPAPNLGPPPPGVPNDGNARFLGGLPGHSGLFGPAGALYRLGAEWLRPRALLTPEGVARATGGRGRFALGWWRRRLLEGGGPALPAAAFGHTGFPGGNLWVDPEAGRVLVLLAHRTSAAVPINRRRRRFHTLAYHRDPR
ncbi:MAG TPA: serine hydrolase domain-containing protein [Thermoanaerobaculia bacterium]|nr:serine hydrolase domain-containing protein [Thermoanaerobaculia bacterium]